MARMLEDFSFDDSQDYVQFTLAALSVAAEDGDKEVGALSEPLVKQRKAWEALDAQARELRFRAIAANARVRLRDVQCDEAETAFHNDTLGYAKQDRQAPIFVQMFPQPLSKMVALRLEAELAVLRDQHAKLLLPSAPAELKKAHEKPLARAIERGEAAVRLRESVEREREVFGAGVQDWKQRTSSVLLSIEGALTRIAGERRLGRAWVQAFFMPVASTRKKAKKEADGKSGEGERQVG